MFCLLEVGQCRTSAAPAFPRGRKRDQNLTSAHDLTPLASVCVALLPGPRPVTLPEWKRVRGGRGVVTTANSKRVRVHLLRGGDGLKVWPPWTLSPEDLFLSSFLSSFWPAEALDPTKPKG